MEVERENQQLCRLGEQSGGAGAGTAAPGPLGTLQAAGHGNGPPDAPAPGEELWDIAKAHGTTMTQILQANELEGETLPVGRMSEPSVSIPPCSTVKIML